MPQSVCPVQSFRCIMGESLRAWLFLTLFSQINFGIILSGSQDSSHGLFYVIALNFCISFEK